MYHFGPRSRENLDTCHPLLRELFEEVIKTVDCSVTDGFRDKERQNDAYNRGVSKVKFPHSKHNQSPSIAADVIPWPVDWEDRRRFYYFAGHVMATATRLRIQIKWGGDWDGDFNFKDQNFHDLPHFQLKSLEKIHPGQD